MMSERPPRKNRFAFRRWVDRFDFTIYCSHVHLQLIHIKGHHRMSNCFVENFHSKCRTFIIAFHNNNYHWKTSKVTQYILWCCYWKLIRFYIYIFRTSAPFHVYDELVVDTCCILCIWYVPHSNEYWMRWKRVQKKSFEVLSFVHFFVYMYTYMIQKRSRN